MRNFSEGLSYTKTPAFSEKRLLELRQETFDVLGILSNFNESIKSSVLGIGDFLIQLSTFDGNNKTASAVGKLISKTQNKVENMNFIVMGETAVPCPDGFKDDFSGYILALSNERDAIISQAFSALEDFNTYLASFTGNKDSKISLKDDGKKYKAMKQARETQVKKFHSYFTSGVNQRQYLNKMFEAKSVIIPTAKMSVDLWKYVKEIEPRDVQAKCQVISTRLQNILDKEGGNKSDVSKQTLLNLAEGSYEIARQVEHLALYLARCEIASVTTGNILERLDNLIKT